ncbi:MAG TPA: hypothetical protein VFF08_03380, partial [Trueperaceae bacterium]|nr:hypothetical protein [Trueperaceae bacterium]
LLFSFWAFGLVYYLPLLRIRRPALPPRLFWGAVGLLTLGAVAFAVWTFGLPTSLPGLGAIYEVREDYRADLQASGRLAALAITWLVNLAGPLLIARGLVGRRWRWVVVGVGVELLAFAITGYKSALLAPVAIVAVHVLVRYGARSLGSILSVGVLLLIGSAVVVDALLNQIFLTSWLVRRLLVTPGLVAGRFFEFFSENGFAYLGHSVLGGLVRAPYDLSPPELIGLTYDGRVYSANANFWADGYANFGVLGMLVATLLAAGVAYAVDSIAARLSEPGRRAAALLLIQPAITLSNSAVITSLVSHGIVIMVLLLLVAPSHLAPAERRRRRRVGAGAPARAPGDGAPRARTSPRPALPGVSRSER